LDKAKNGAFCVYGNTKNADTLKDYGRLYNYYAVKTAKLCPTGVLIKTMVEESKPGKPENYVKPVK